VRVSEAVRSAWADVYGCVSSALARPFVRPVAGNVAVGVGYWSLAMLGSVAQYRGNIQVAWLPVGWAAGMLYLGDLRWWVGGAIGDLMIGDNFVPFHGVALTGQSWVTTAGNTAEFVVAAVLMRRWLGRGNRLERPADVMLLIVAIGIGTAISAAVGNLAAVWLARMPWRDLASSLRTWWLGDTSGGLLVAPLLLAWWRTSLRSGRRMQEAVQAAVILTGVVGLSVAVFSSRHPLTYIVFPALVVAAVYLGQRGATVALVLAYAVAVAMTAASVGPFVSRSIDDQTLSSQLYILIATVTTLTLGAAVSARHRAAMELVESRRREAERAAEERQRIARDLHDSVSQTLFTLGLQAAIAKHAIAEARLAEESALPGAIEEVAELARGALLEMRTSIFDLRGGAVAEQGLVAALGAHAAALAVRHDVHVTVDGPQDRLPLSPETEELLFRIGQEAITNAVKHSGSPTVSAAIFVDHGTVGLLIRDHGVGFDPSRSYGGHLGLELMRSRTADAGGSIAIESTPEAGTTVRAVVPANATAAAPRAPRAPQAAPPASVR
jgi:signal transduction histidine kinase